MAKQAKLSQKIGFWVGIAAFVVVLFLKTPAGMEPGAKQQ